MARASPLRRESTCRAGPPHPSNPRIERSHKEGLRGKLEPGGLHETLCPYLCSQTTGQSPVSPRRYSTASGVGSDREPGGVRRVEPARREGGADTEEPRLYSPGAVTRGRSGPAGLASWAGQNPAQHRAGHPKDAAGRSGGVLHVRLHCGRGRELFQGAGRRSGGVFGQVSGGRVGPDLCGLHPLQTCFCACEYACGDRLPSAAGSEA